MRVVVYGLWHLGCVTAACLADAGNEVVGLDVDGPLVDKLKNGTLTLLAQDQTKELAHLNFFNLGIFNLVPNLGGGEASRPVTAEMFCERVEFVYHG